eukprot:180728-Chlamydomonas_euryale.AAC.1
MVWIDARISEGVSNLNERSVYGVLCPYLYYAVSDAVVSKGLSPEAVMPGAGTLNGCDRISPSDTAGGRVLYKIFLHMPTPADWEFVSARLYSDAFVRSGHVLCGSRVYFQTAASPAVNTRPVLNKWSRPQWLDPAGPAAGSVCYMDAYQPLLVTLAPPPPPPSS